MNAVYLEQVPHAHITMHPEHDKEQPKDPAVESLAREFRVPIDDVALIYVRELAKLRVGAHLTNFLPIFAIRNARERLRQRGMGKLATA